MQNPFEAGRSKSTNNFKEISKVNKRAKEVENKICENHEQSVGNRKADGFWTDMNVRYGNKYQQLLDILKKVDEYKWYIIIFSSIFTGISYIVIPAIIFIKPLTKWFFETLIEQES